MKNDELTHDSLVDLLFYDKVTGLFTRRSTGKLACFVSKSSGYRRVAVDGKRFLAHRLAWFYVTGTWPELDIDHKDRQRDNNKWENLRCVDRSTNLRNQIDPRYSNKTSGIRGVSWDKSRGKWSACISVMRKTRHLGRFDTKELAAKAYQNARDQYP